jgi:hypothetical protein
MKISFYPSCEEVYENIQNPVPAKNVISQWYKDIKPSETLNVKNCIPFLDTMTSGYMQLTWEDIHVEYINNNLTVYTTDKTGIPLFNARNKSDILINENFYNIEFIWSRQWSIGLPDGYSALITHPLNRYDLPFITMSGIVDSDKYNHSPVGNIPFYLSKNFQGVIPKGTPMFQIIPIKREDWVFKKEIYDKEDWGKKEKKRNLIQKGLYKKMFWQKKSFD